MYNEIYVSNLENLILSFHKKIQLLVSYCNGVYIQDLEKMLEDMTKQLELNQALMADSQSTAVRQSLITITVSSSNMSRAL